MTFVPCRLLAEAAPAWLEQLGRVLTLQDYNARMVLLGTTLLGTSGGLVGTFLLLRKQSLIGDVVGHAALPGIAVAFLASQMLAPATGKNLPWLMAGAFVAGLLGAVSALTIDRYSKVKADAALAIVLSLFYGVGTALLTVIQKLPTASAAGLKTYLNGKTASLVAADVWLFAAVACGLILIVLLLFKELTLLCFDDQYAAATGWPVFWLDSLLIGLAAGVTVVGMQTVGLVLVAAILIIPPAAARFWTDSVRGLTAISALLGALSGLLGALASALAPRIAAGAVIVLCSSLLFTISLLLGFRRGLLWRWRNHRRLQKQIGQSDLLRAVYEHVEAASPDEDISESRLIEVRLHRDELLPMRSWSRRRLGGLIWEALRDDRLEIHPNGTFSLTANGAALARRAVRNHRLVEIYLITSTDAKPLHADYDADRLEHILGPDLIRELEERLAAEDQRGMPSSPHNLSAPDQPLT